jgi:hypothetical protein
MSAAARLLGLRFRIPLESRMFVFRERYELCQIEASATSRSLVQRSPTECVCVCVIVSDQMRHDKEIKID